MQEDLEEPEVAGKGRVLPFFFRLSLANPASACLKAGSLSLGATFLSTAAPVVGCGCTKVLVSVFKKAENSLEKEDLSSN